MLYQYPAPPGEKCGLDDDRDSTYYPSINFVPIGWSHVNPLNLQ